MPTPPDAVPAPTPISADELVGGATPAPAMLPAAEAKPPAPLPAGGGAGEPPFAPPAAPAAPAPAGEPLGKDSLGRDFDPAKFRPKKDTQGRWCNLNSGRKAKQTELPTMDKPTTRPTPKPAPVTVQAAPAGAQSPPPPAAASFVPPDDPTAAHVRTDAPTGTASEIVDFSNDCAEVFCNATYTAFGFAFDAPEEWTPGNAQHENARKTVAAWLRTKNIIWRPVLGVLMVFAAYVLTGIRKPKSRVVAMGWKARLGAFFKKRPPTPPPTIPDAPTAKESAPKSPTPSTPAGPVEDIPDFAR